MRKQQPATSENNELDAALAAYEQATTLAPNMAKLHYYKGHILEQLGRIADAQLAYEEACKLGYSGPHMPNIKKVSG